MPENVVDSILSYILFLLVELFDIRKETNTLILWLNSGVGYYLFVIVLKKECIIIQYWLKESFCTYREVTEVFMLEIQFLWHQRWWMTSINVVAPSLGHHAEAMIPLKLLTAFRTGALIRLICLAFLIHTSDRIRCIYFCKLIPCRFFFSSLKYHLRFT